tara:strand:+ start:527 stop:763 length:237 start_codon:yes stop_codon:yes gene_type:complete
MSDVKKLTTSRLKQLVMEEKRKLNVSADEVDAKDMANTLAKNVDYLKALKIHEARLTSKLKKVIKEKNRVKKKIIGDL